MCLVCPDCGNGPFYKIFIPPFKTIIGEDLIYHCNKCGWSGSEFELIPDDLWRDIQLSKVPMYYI